MTAMDGVTPVPVDMASDIYEDSLEGVPGNWPRFTDRDSDCWWITGRSHDNDAVLMPSASDVPMMLRRDAERLYGPFTAVGHGPTGGER